MKKALFFVLPEKGHLNPAIGPAQALQARNFEVSFASVGDLSKQLACAGLRFDRSLVASHPPAQPMRGQALVELIQDPAALRTWIRTLLLQVSEEDLQAHLDLISKLRPDVIVVDPLGYASVIAAEFSQIPWVSMSNSLNPILEDDVRSELLDTLEALRFERAALFARHEVRSTFRGCDALSRHLTLAFCTEEFVGARESSVRMLGPSLPQLARGDEELPAPASERPFFYVSFGSQLSHWPEIFGRLIEATTGAPYDLVLSVGDLAPTLKSKSPPHVHIYEYAPQLQILKRSNGFLTHGGANSVMEALHLGVPLWVSPMCNDQFHQAHYVRKSGVGVVRDIRTMSASEIRATIDELLANAEIRARLTTVSASYQRDGSKLAAELIAGLL